MESIKVANGVAKVGSAVSAEVSFGERAGQIHEGNVLCILPYPPPAPCSDPGWDKENACVVIEDHETHIRTHFRPSKVFLVNGEEDAGCKEVFEVS